jgi:hypothetical protein
MMAARVDKLGLSPAVPRLRVTWERSAHDLRRPGVDRFRAMPASAGAG